MTDKTDTKTKEETSKAAVKSAVEPALERADIREADGAPKGCAYRLLLASCDLGERGQIVTLTLADAQALADDIARIPTAAELQIGLT